MSRTPTAAKEGGVQREDLENLFAKHRPWLVSRATHICGTTAEAEEAVQEAFIRLIQKFKNDMFPSEGACVQWLITTTSRLCYDYLRQQRCRQNTESSLIIFHKSTIAPEALTHSAWENITNAQIEEAAKALPLHLRLTWELSSQGLSYAQVAIRLGIKPGNVGKRLHTARLKLRTFLQQFTKTNARAV